MHMLRYGLILQLLTIHIFSTGQTVSKDRIPKQPFVKYIKKNTLKDNSTFYLSQSTVKESLPLVIFIQGSGNTSLYEKSNDRVIPQYGHMTWYDVSNNQFRVLVMEKPGVNYLQQTGIISPLAKQYFSTNSGAILLV